LHDQKETTRCQHSDQLIDKDTNETQQYNVS